MSSFKIKKVLKEIAKTENPNQDSQNLPTLSDYLYHHAKRLYWQGPSCKTSL